MRPESCEPSVGFRCLADAIVVTQIAYARCDGRVERLRFRLLNAPKAFQSTRSMTAAHSAEPQAFRPTR